MVVGKTEAMQLVENKIRAVATAKMPVMVWGETGTGKEVAVDRLRRLAKVTVFRPLNCAAISPHLIESELFGHRRGSFTGADRDQEGVYASASGGIMFLDELGELPMEAQAKLLRAIETGKYRRIGDTDERSADVRVVAATNRNPYEAMDTGLLRPDLFYRLMGADIFIPPLRERVEDIPLLAAHFLELDYDNPKKLSLQAISKLCSHVWPGNIRELKLTVERAHLHAGDKPVIEEEDIIFLKQARAEHAIVSLGMTLREATNRFVVATYQSMSRNQVQTAKRLGISRNTLRVRLGEMGQL